MKPGARLKTGPGNGTVIQTARGIWLFLPVAVVALGLAIHVLDLGGLASFVQNVSLARLEGSVALAPLRPAGKAPDVRYVDIDRASVAALGPWPWPRSDLARLVSAAGEARASLVVLDFGLDGPDPVSPKRIIPVLPQDDEGMAVSAALDLLPNSDLILQQALRDIPVVSRIELAKDTRDRVEKLPAPRLSVPPGAERWPPHAHGGRAPFKGLAAASVGLGTSLPLSDGETAYRLPLLVSVGGAMQSTLLLESARLSLGARDASVALFEPESFADQWLGRPGLDSIRLGARVVPVTRDGALLYDPRIRPPVPISAASLLNGGAPKDFAGAVVVIGASAAPDARTFRSPLNAPLAASAALASALDQILEGRFVTRPVWADGGEEIYLLLVGLVLCLLFAYAPVYWPLITGAVACFGAGYLSWLAFSREAWFIDALLPNLVVGTTILAGLYARAKAARAHEDAVRAAAFSALGITPTMGSFLAPRPSSVGTRGELLTLTVMVCDIRGFDDVLTRYHDNPAALTRLIGRYQEVMTEVVHKNKGLVATYYGARIVAYWNASGADSEHSSNACNCALRIIEALERLNEEFADDARQDLVPFESVSVSIGIESGPCVVSLAKEGGRPELVTVGETVALAEALARRAESYGPAAIVGGAAQADAQKLFALLEIDFLRLTQTTPPTHVFALLGNPLVKASPRFRALDATHQEIFNAYRSQNWQLARALVQECRKLPAASSKLYDLYERRITSFERSPPDADWDGAQDLSVS